MSEELTWLLALGALYAAYCLYWGASSVREARGPSDFFLASNQVPAWVFVLTATGVSLSGWLALGHPALVYLDGLQCAQLALASIVIPLAGILFLKRQWIAARRFGHVTPGDLLASYYSGEAIRVVVVIVALVFAIPFVGMQLLASGRLIAVVSGGVMDARAAMWVMTFGVFLYACIGGWRAVTSIGALQAILLVAGVIFIGSLAYASLGGFGAFMDGMARLGQQPEGPQYLAIPGVIQFTEGVGREMPVGGIWTAAMILTYAFALAGVQSSPAFSMLGFSARDMRGFGPQQVWATGGGVGAILLFFAVAQGMGAHFLGASESASALGLGLASTLPALGEGGFMDLSAAYIRSLGGADPWFMALLAVCMLAGIHVAAAVFASAAATSVTHDVVKRFMFPDADAKALKLCARLALAVIFLLALILATFAPVVQAQLGSLALGFGLQLWPALAGLCWFKWVTRQGAILGLIVGMFAVVMTEPLGASALRLVGFELPWGRWPWTIHSAGWGIFWNLVICVPVSLATFRGEGHERQLTYHDYADRRSSPAADRRAMRLALWAVFLIWLFFALGPGAVIGNDFFGAPDGGLESWNLGMPSLWAWQIIWWALGVLVVWWLAYKMELSTSLRAGTEIVRAEEFVGGRKNATPRWIRNLLRRIT